MKEELIRLCGAALLGCVCVLLLRKGSPTLAFLAGLATVLILLSSLADWVFALIRNIGAFGKGSVLQTELTEALIKVSMVSILSKLAAMAARDAEQNALSYLLELLGTVCALLLALPVLERVLAAVESCFS